MNKSEARGYWHANANRTETTLIGCAKPLLPENVIMWGEGKTK